MTRNRSATYRTVLVALAAASALSLSLAGCGTSATPSTKATSTSASGAASTFYQGKTVNLIVGNAPGTGPANAMVALRSALETKLDATINMTFSTANPIVPEDQVGTAAPDGLTMGELSLGSALVAEIAGTGTPQFSLQKASFAGALLQQDDVVVACAHSPFTSMAQVIAGKTPVTMVSQKNTNNGLIASYVLGAWPVKHTWDYYSGSADQTAGCERGDGNLSVGTVTSFTDAAGTAMDPGITPLLLMSKEPTTLKGSFLNARVPTVATFLKSHPARTASGKEAIALLGSVFTDTTPSFAVFGPAGIPASRVAAFAAAMKSAVAEPSVTTAFESQSQPPGFVPPAAVQSFVAATLQDSSKIKPYLSSQ